MDELITKVFPAENAVFSGGIGLAVIATGAQLLRAGTKVGFRMLQRHLLVSLEITSKDRAYPWVLTWLSAQKSHNRHLSVETIFNASSNSPNNSAIRFNLVPGPGQHFVTYRGYPMLVQRIREQQMLDLNSGKPWEKIIFTGLGQSTATFHRILDEAMSTAMKQEEGTTTIFTNWGSEWRPFGQSRRKREMESVILDKGVSERLYEDVLEWTKSAHWYTHRGIPYRRGYLLYGPPGSGKSSFIFALAGKLDLNICMLNLSERGLTDDRLALALSNIPPKSLVLLEDIDAAFPAGRGHDNSRRSEVTFSGLLNVLDGVSASEDRLVFMTTNHIDRLDSALIRPGRVDLKQMIGNATDFQIESLFCNFYNVESPEQANTFLRLLRENTIEVSMAALQGFFLLFKNDMDGALKHIKTFDFLSSGKINDTVPKQSDSNVEVPTTSRLRPVRPLTVQEVDKIYFNPQKGWDDNIK